MLMLNDDEKAFLRNSQILRRWFYKTYVPEAMVAFNNAVSGTSKYKHELALEELHTKKIRDTILRIIGRTLDSSEK